jgi:sulfonate transport system substrate-binding protein
LAPKLLAAARVRSSCVSANTLPTVESLLSHPLDDARSQRLGRRTLLRALGAYLSAAVCTPSALGCRAEPPAALQSARAGAGIASPATSAPVPSVSEEVVRLGYQKYGSPFLLKSRAQDLQARLSREHARVEWVEFQAGPPLLEAMRGGAVDIGYTGETPPVFAQAGGVPFVYAAHDPPAPEAEAIVVPKASPITRLEELRGKRVALNRGSNVHYLLVRALASVGLTLSDLQLVYLAPADARSAFESGRVDAWVIWDPFLAAAELAGARTLRNGAGLVDNHQFYLVRREFAEARPELVQLVLNEYERIGVWATSHVSEAVALMSQSSGIDRAAILLAEHRHSYALETIDTTVLAQQQSIGDTFQRLALIPTTIATEQAFLPRVAYQAAR